MLNAPNSTLISISIVNKYHFRLSWLIEVIDHLVVVMVTGLV